MMRVAVVSAVVLAALGAVWLFWPSPPRAAAVVVDAGTLAMSSAPPSSPPSSPPLGLPSAPVPPPPEPGCGVSTWDDLVLDPAAGPPPEPGERRTKGVDDRSIGPAMAAPWRIGSIRTGACAGAVVYRFFGPIEVFEGGCIDAGSFLVDGSTENNCDDAPDEVYQLNLRPVGYTAETATTVVLLTAMGDVTRSDVEPGVAGRSMRVDTTSTLPGLPLATEMIEPDSPPWVLQTVSYSPAHAHALGIIEVPCLSPRQGPEGSFRRCKDTLRLTRPDGVVAIYGPAPMNVALEGYAVRPLPADRAGFVPDVPGTAGATVDVGAIARAHARAAGHKVAVLQRSAAEAMLERARAIARQDLPPKGELFDDEAVADPHAPWACRSTTCREAYDAFLGMGLDEFMGLTPAILVTDRFGRRLHFVRVLFDFPLR